MKVGDALTIESPYVGHWDAPLRQYRSLPFTNLPGKALG